MTRKSIHVIPAIALESSGPSYSVPGLCKGLIGQGLDVVLAALDWSTATQPLPFVKTFPLGAGPRRLGRSPAMKRWLDNQVRSGAADVLHSHGMWQMSAVYPGWAARQGHVLYVVSPRGAFTRYAMASGSRLKRVFWPLVQRRALEEAACFHATAESEYDDIRRQGFLQPVCVIPNGIDIPDPVPKTGGSMRTLLFLGRIHPNKGVDILLRAWACVQNRFRDWRLRIVGSDVGYYGNTRYGDVVRSLAASLGLQRVEFAGELSGADKLRAFTQAEIFVLPSRSENFGMTVAESLAAGTPAIVCRGAPWSGLGTHSAGWWIDTNVDALVGCFQNALAMTPESLIAMGLRGRAWVSAEFSWQRIGLRMAETYEWLANGRRSPPEWIHTN